MWIEELQFMNNSCLPKSSVRICHLFRESILLVSVGLLKCIRTCPTLSICCEVSNKFRILLEKLFLVKLLGIILIVPNENRNLSDWSSVFERLEELQVEVFNQWPDSDLCLKNLICIMQFVSRGNLMEYTIDKQ